MHWAYFRACWVTLFDAPDELDPPGDAAVVVVGSELGDPPLHAARATAKLTKSAPNSALLRTNDRRGRAGSGLPGEWVMGEVPFGSGRVVSLVAMRLRGYTAVTPAPLPRNSSEHLPAMSPKPSVTTSVRGVTALQPQASHP